MREITTKITPVREMFYSSDSNYGIYACISNEKCGFEYNKYGNFSVKGNCVRLQLDYEYDATLIEQIDKKRGTYYEIKSIYQEVPKDIEKQKDYLRCIITEKQVNEIYKVYPNEDVIQLIRDDKFEIDKVKGVGLKTFLKIKDKIIENLEFQQAFEFLSGYGVTNNMIIKLVKHFKSASLLIKKMQDNPFCITEVNGVGFKKADTIAMSMGYDPQGEFRILSSIEYVIDEQSNAGHTYVDITDINDLVYELIGIDRELIDEQIKDTSKVIVVGDKIALKKNYNAEKQIARRLKEILDKSSEFDFDVDKFITEQEEEFGIALTNQQKGLFNNIKKYNVNLLVGYAGVGKSQITALLINMLEQLNITYRLLSPTGKAAKVLSKYTGREVETVHRAIGLGERKDDEAQKVIEEEFVIGDETSMLDVQLGAKLLSKCKNKNVRILFIGDDFQIPSVGAGNVLHDLIHSGVIPVTKLDIVFRQKEGGILDVATKVRLKEKFVDNDFWGIQKFGNNCVLASVPQDKMIGGYQYYFKAFLKQYNSSDITIVTPTKKSGLGTVEINKVVQNIVNPESDSKVQKEYGFDKVIFREGDLVLNTKNTYEILDVNEKLVNIVNGDIGTIESIDLDEEEMIVYFGFAKIPIEFKLLNQFLHAWCMTKHKMQGSSASVVIAIADKSHKFQLNANLIYTAFTRPTDYLVIISQAETINFAMKKIANLQRNTFLKDMLMNSSSDESDE